MPYTVPNPTTDQFRTYLENLLKTFDKTYQVQYVPPQKDAGNSDIEGTDFFNITKKSSNNAGVLKTNLKINLGHESRFRTTYGGQTPQQFERAPEILTGSGQSAYTVGGSWASVATVVDQPGGKSDIDIRHDLRSPIESLATLISTGFSDVEKENRFNPGAVTGDVTSKIMNLLSTGSSEHSDFAVPAGALMTTTGIDVDAVRRKAAQAIQLVNSYDPTGTAEVGQFAQREAIAKARENMMRLSIPVPGRGGKPIDSFFKEAGYAPDRAQADRLVALSQASRVVRDALGQPTDTEIYLPSPKIAKHMTILSSGRQQASLLGEDYQPIAPKMITGRVPTSGYRMTTADVGGRIPEKSLVLGTMFSPQYPIPGAGMYFPETVDANVKSGGYKATQSFGVTRNVKDLLTDKTQLNLQQQTGNVIPSSLNYDVFSMRTKEMKKSDPDIMLQQRAGTHSFAVGNQQLRIPRYYTAEGIGASYDKQMLRKKQLQEVTPAEIEALSKRLGVNVVPDATIEEVLLEMEGQKLVGGKFAIEGVKSDITPYTGTPTFSAGGKERAISAVTWESKQMLETFTGSLGAISPTAQYGILNEYQKSLTASGDTDMAANVRAVIKQQKALRREDPTARLDLQAAANQIAGTATDAPVHGLSRDIFQRVFLGGSKVQDFAGMNEADLSAFAQSDLNVRNLKKFGMGWVSPEMSNPITTMWDRSQVEALFTGYRQGSNVPEAELRARFGRQYGFDFSNAKGDQIAQTFRPSGFYMPAIAGPSVEFSGGGTLGSEETQILSAIAPGFANRLGANAEGLTRRDPVRWAQRQIAHIAATEMDRGEGKYTKIDNALQIGTEQATKMWADPEFRALLGDEAGDLAGMKRFEEKLKSFFPGSEDLNRRPITFEAAPGRYLPSTRAISALATESSATMRGGIRTGEDVTRSWNMFQSAFSQAVTSQINEDPTGLLEGTQNLTSHFMRQFGLPEGGKRDVIKKMMGSEIGVASGHYAFWNELKQNEVYASKEKYMEAIRKELSAQGLDTPERPLSNQEVEQVYNMIAGLPSEVGTAPNDVRTKGLPGVVARWPIVAGEESMLGMRFVTPEHLQRSGRQAPVEAGMGNLHWRIGVGPSSIMQGDFDLDYMLGLMGLTGTRDESGKLDVSFAAYNRNGRLGKDISALVNRTQQMSYETIQRILYPSKNAQQQFDPIFQAFQDRDKTGTLGPMQQVARNLIGEQFGKSGWQPYGHLLDSVATYGGAKMMMGTSYNFTRALEAAAGVGGWSTEGIMQGRRGRAQIYQPHLDLQTSQAAPMVRMYQSSFLAEGKGGKLGLGFGTDVAGYGLQFMKNAGKIMNLSEDNTSRIITMLAGSAITPTTAGELPSPEMLGYAFSPEEGRVNTAPEDMQTSLDLFTKWKNAERHPENAAEYNKRADYEEAYMRTTGLADVLQAPYNMEGTTDERATAMQHTLSQWMKYNYYGTKEGRETALQGNFITAMFSKSYAKKQEKEPGWTPPLDFRTSKLGSRMMGKANIQAPLFNMMKGGLSSGRTLRRLLNSIGQTSGLTSWATGNLQALGFGTDETIFPQSQVSASGNVRSTGPNGEPIIVSPEMERLWAKDWARMKNKGLYEGNFGQYIEERKADLARLNTSFAGKPVDQARVNPETKDIEGGFENIPMVDFDAINNAQPEPEQTQTTTTQPEQTTAKPQQKTPKPQQPSSTQKPQPGGTQPPNKQPPGGGTSTPVSPTTPPSGTPPPRAPQDASQNTKFPGLPANSIPTEQAQEYIGKFREYMPNITQAAGAIQSELGAITGATPGPMGVYEAMAQLPEEQRMEILKKYQEPARQAQELMGLAKKVYPNLEKNVIDPAVLRQFGMSGADLRIMSEDTLLTNNPVGQNLVDLGGLTGVPGFETLKKRGGTTAASGQVSANIAQIHFQELGEITKKLTENFENLSKGQIKHSDALKEETKLLEQREQARQKQALSEKAAPLVEQGLLEPEITATKRGKPQISYKRTDKPIPQEMYKASQAYDEQLLKTEGLGGTEGQDRLIGGVRPSFMRRVLGGFGLMYMRSLGNIITGGLGYGQQERTNMEQVFGASAGGMAGIGYTPQNQAQVLQNRMALGGQAYNPMLGLQMARAQSPLLQDISAAGGAGLGTYALLQQAALWGGEGSIFQQIANGGLSAFGGRLNIGAGTVVGGAVGASLLAQGYAKSQDTEGLAYRWGTGNAFSKITGLTDTLGRIGAGQAFTGDIYQRGATYRMLQENLQRPEGMTTQGVMDWVTEQGLGGQKYVDAGTPEGQAWYGQATQKLLLDQNPEFAPETIAATYQFMQRNQMNLKDFGTIASQFQTGYTEESVSSMLKGFGMSMGQQLSQTENWAGGNAPTNLGVAYMQTLGMINQNNAPQFQAGLEYMGQLGFAPQIMQQQQGLSNQEMVNQVLQWGGQGAMQGGLYAQRAQAYQQGAFMGWNVQAPEAPPENLTPEQFGQGMYESQKQSQKMMQIEQIANQFSSNFGWSGEQRQGFLGDMESFYKSGRFNAYYADVLGGASQMNPYAMTQLYTQQQPGGALAGIGPQIQPWQVTKDIWGPGAGELAGKAVNLPAFTVSGGTHPQFQALSEMLGPDFMQQLLGTDAGNAFVNGYQMEGTNMPAVAGLMGYQMQQADKQWDLRQAQMGISDRGNQLQMEYLPKIWNIQDQMRDLGYRHQMFQFGQQEKQIAMQAGQFYENIGLSEYQSQLQRGWTQQDWAFNSETRAMQHGWRVEDFEEQRRFMTGRQRRLAERQMERENITYGREGEQIDRQQERQKELWALEDERFQMQKDHYEEQRQMQEESLKENKKYYEQNFELQKKLTDLQRELTMKQLELQKESLELQKQIAEEQHKMQQVQQAIQLLMLQNQTKLEDSQQIFGGISEEMRTLFEDWADVIGNGGSGSGGYTNYTVYGSGGASGTINSGVRPEGSSGGMQMAEGGDFWVGENGPELLSVGMDGPTTRMRGRIQPTKYDPWGSTAIDSKPSFKETKEQTIVVQIGNEEIKRFVVRTVEDDL